MNRVNSRNGYGHNVTTIIIIVVLLLLLLNDQNSDEPEAYLFVVTGAIPLFTRATYMLWWPGVYLSVCHKSHFYQNR